MLNPFKEVDWNPDLPARRKFAVSLIIGFPIVALVVLLIGRVFGDEWKWVVPLWIASCGAGTGLVLWAIPQIAKPFYCLWYAFGCSMGIIIGNLLMCAFFYLVITPFGLARRLSKRPAILKGTETGAETYWQDVEAVKDPKRYYRQY
mgnify:CR=1 FL=1